MSAVFTQQLLAVLHDRRVEEIIAGKGWNDDNTEE